MDDVRLFQFESLAGMDGVILFQSVEIEQSAESETVGASYAVEGVTLTHYVAAC